MNVFGLYREYVADPTYSPDDSITLEDVSHPAMQPDAVSPSAPGSMVAPASRPAWFPFANFSIFLIITWLFTGSNQKSQEETDRLVDVLRTPGFSVDDLSDFSAKREVAMYDKHLKTSLTSSLDDPSSSVSAEDVYVRDEIPIQVPDGRPHRPGTEDPPIPVYHVPEFIHRSIVDIIKNVWSSESVLRYHLTPFRQHWQRDTENIERVHGELYASESFIRANEEVQNLPATDGCTLERVVCALMFWSDATHLANFGTAALWPIYLFFGNESKYTRASMHSRSCHHVGYIPKVCTLVLA